MMNTANEIVHVMNRMSALLRELEHHMETGRVKLLPPTHGLCEKKQGELFPAVNQRLDSIPSNQRM